VLLASVITFVAIGIGEIEVALFGYAIIEPLVWTPPAIHQPGIAWSGKQLLEFAIVLLGATLDAKSIADAGIRLLVAVTLVVVLTLVAGAAIGRAAGLPPRLAILVAVGNAICGNSAIAAVAPAIRATKQEIASAIALTAVFGIGVVLALPLLHAALSMSDERYGVFAGMTVYAVPQVLAATIPVSAVAGQFGSIAKLTRVLFLGPVVAFFAWRYREGDASGSGFSLTKFVPWFVIGFAAMMILRTAHVIPDDLGDLAKDVSKVLTAIAMAALGLGVDIRAVTRTGRAVLVTVAAITVLLAALALLLVTVFAIG
jgi:uncharacterized integral membrane protein (TIGR00698 family)